MYDYTVILGDSTLAGLPVTLADHDLFFTIRAHSLINLIGDLDTWGIVYNKILATSEAQGAPPVDTFQHAALIPLLLTMKDKGGGFASALATAWLRADESNSRKLWAEFKWELLQYGPKYSSILGE